MHIHSLNPQKKKPSKETIKLAAAPTPDSIHRFNLNRPVPVVRFEYPDRETLLLKTRFVRVVDMTDDYLRGYEINSYDGIHPVPAWYNESEGKFKKFNLRRIAKNSIVLVAYSDEY